MYNRDLHVGLIVYHCVFPHWGKGTVLAIRFITKASVEYKVEWEYTFGNGGKTNWCKPRELRKTFNYKKVALVASFKK
jgi:hypothetical protein